MSVLLAAMAAMVIGASAAQASLITLTNTPTGDTLGAFGRRSTIGQTFTAPVTGTLTSFTLWLNGGVDSLQGGVGTWNGTIAFGAGFGSPTNLFLSASLLSPPAGPQTFTPILPVTAGLNYVAYLTMFGDRFGTKRVFTPQADSPAGINYFVWNNWSANELVDLVGEPDKGNPVGNPSWTYWFTLGSARFEAVFSPSIAVSAPTALALFGVALVGLGFARRGGAD